MFIPDSIFFHPGSGSATLLNAMYLMGVLGFLYIDARFAGGEEQSGQKAGRYCQQDVWQVSYVLY
jgi:hypothetical protein